MDLTTWPGAIFALGVLAVAAFVFTVVVAGRLESRQTKLKTEQAEDLRQLVRRYEQLSENTLDVQQRLAADLAELRTRTNSIEQILRTVE